MRRLNVDPLDCMPAHVYERQVANEAPPPLPAGLTTTTTTTAAHRPTTVHTWPDDAADMHCSSCNITSATTTTPTSGLGSHRIHTTQTPDPQTDSQACTQWQVAVSPNITWIVTKAGPPNLLIRASLTEGAPEQLTEQEFHKYKVGPPSPSRWLLPAAWNCSK